ncbi:hypothetical protein GCM10028868_16070 [Virgibacillus kimchii]
MRYIEERNEFTNTNRIIVDRFKIYYKRAGNNVIIVGIKFPVEN